MTQTLIIGGTGKTGRRVHNLLLAKGVPAVSLSRPRFDWSDPTTWASVDTDATCAYLTYAPDIAFPGAADAVAVVAGRLFRGGVKHLVLLTGRGEVEAQRAEQLVIESAREHDASWAVVRCSFFMQNFSESLFAEPIAEGDLAFIAGEVREPFVDADDIAEVVVGVLTGQVPANQIYELTGPQLLTFSEAVAAISEATGRRTTYTEITVPQFVVGLTEAGLPMADAVGLGDLFTHILDGHNEQLVDGVNQALGREAGTFAAYARRAAGEGAWARESATNAG